MNSLQLLPHSASTFSSEYDVLFWIMVLICGTVTGGIALFIVYSAIRYHRKRDNELPPQNHGNLKVEATWTFIPLFIFLGMFGWGAKLYYDVERPPAEGIDIYVVGKQWMWKLQHVNGQREINTLHVPINRPIRLTITSQDVIHSFFMPDFRVKYDAIPGRYVTTWFQATKPGRYHLFCAEYCGTKHSGMIGWIYAMTPQDYARWLTEGAAEGSLASVGAKLFHQFGCANCHRFDGRGRCPDLRNLYNHPVQLRGGGTVVADPTYIRESMVDPKAKVVYGFEPIMPTFQGQLTEEQIIAIISFIRAIGPEPGTASPSSAGSVPASELPRTGITGPGASSISESPPEVK